jgi:transposase
MRPSRAEHAGAPGLAPVRGGGRETLARSGPLDTNTDITKGYLLKEAFRDVFTATNLVQGRKRLALWETQVRESGVPELIKVLRTIKRRRRGIENYFQHRAANGMAEGFNNVVGTIKKQAYGFHDSSTIAST